MNKFRVSIEVGHGGTDSGAIGVGVHEKHLTLTVALELMRILTEHGVDVLISRETDVDDPSQAFYYKALAFKPDVGISVHFNSFTDATATGYEVGRSSNIAFKGDSDKLCLKINNEVLSKFPLQNRGIKDYNFIMTRLPCPYAYLEPLFISNPNDYKLIDSEEKLHKLAECYAKGILSYLGIEYRGNVIYRVQVGAFRSRTNAENYLKEVKEKGFKDSYIVEV